MPGRTPWLFSTMLSLTTSSLSSVSAFEFLVMGDWGGEPYWPYETPGEVAVAGTMGTVAGDVKAKFALALGDNFYTEGVTSVDDSRFHNTFERVFSSDNLKSDNFFRVVAGNHDHRGNCSAEIAYSEKSARWHFPSYYYDFQETTEDGQKVHIVMIDTVLLSGQSHDSEGNSLPGTQYPGPANISVAEAQWDWINRTLSSSDADFLIVGGHFPVWSICEHGPTPLLQQRLKPMLEAASASAYLAGHDHCAQYLDEGKGVQYHGIGAGIMVNPSTSHKDDVPAGVLKWHYDDSFFGYFQGAFGRVTISKDQGMVVRHYASSGKVIYEAPAIAPRKVQPDIQHI
mmetsp:Transcript_65606/g.137136  ORF Transcript_65606/g.137136 Transcript_65606/m.137136 type:complete len:342 (-) Transcript_65606:143-1168(-)